MKMDMEGQLLSHISQSYEFKNFLNWLSLYSPRCSQTRDLPATASQVLGLEIYITKLGFIVGSVLKIESFD